MTRYATIISLCIGLAAFSANADVVHSTGFDADGAAQGTGFGILPGSIAFNGGGGDHVGFPGVGLSNANPSSGSFSYVIDSGATAENGNGWGATWAGISNIDGANSGGFTDPATAQANGGNYINYNGAEFTASALVATDASDPLTGSGTAAIRLEFYYDIDADGDGVGDSSTEIVDVLPRVIGTTLGAGDLSTDYTATTVSFDFDTVATALDFANIAAPNAGETVVGLNRVTAVIGTDGHGFGATDGLILVDDLLFEVSGENVVSVVPEPGSISLLLAGFLSLCGLVRRKRS